MTSDAIDEARKREFEKVYLVLSGIFIAALVACNLIFQKFFVFDIPLPFGGTYTMTQSVGLLAYPVTFLVTDILSEIYGRERANNVVTSGLVASIFVLLLIEVSDATRSASFGTSAETFHKVFGLSKAAIASSMVAYLVAQYLDIRMFHFWRRLTAGKHLWLRNNASTFASQFVDTIVVVCLLAAFKAGIEWHDVPRLVRDGLVFKWVFAALDTPLFAASNFMRRRYPGLAQPADSDE